MCFTKTDRTNYLCLISHTQGTLKRERILTAFLTSSYLFHFPLAAQHRDGTCSHSLFFPLTIFIYSEYTGPFGQQLLNHHLQAISCSNVEGSEKKIILSVNCGTYLGENMSFGVAHIAKRKKVLKNL